MPVVELKTLGRLSHQQKAEITRRFTRTLQDVAGKEPGSVYVIIREIEPSNWGHAGELFSDK